MGQGHPADLEPSFDLVHSNPLLEATIARCIVSLYPSKALVDGL